jgi:hypothetical protein
VYSYATVRNGARLDRRLHESVRRLHVGSFGKYGLRAPQLQTGISTLVSCSRAYTPCRSRSVEIAVIEDIDESGNAPQSKRNRDVSGPQFRRLDIEPLRRAHGQILIHGSGAERFSQDSYAFASGAPDKKPRGLRNPRGLLATKRL